MLKVKEQVLLLSSWLSRTEVVSTLSPLLTSQFTLLQHRDPPPWLVPGAGAGTQHHRHRVLKHGHQYQYTIQPRSYWSLSWNRAGPPPISHSYLDPSYSGVGVASRLADEDGVASLLHNFHARVLDDLRKPIGDFFIWNNIKAWGRRVVSLAAAGGAAWPHQPTLLM